MLRITITDTPTEQKWVLHSRLTEPCVSELRSNWMRTRDARQGRRCVVDLDEVTFIDESGESVLLAMMRQDVRFVASGVCTKQLLEDLRSKNKHRLRKCMEYLPVFVLGVAILPTAWGQTRAPLKSTMREAVVLLLTYSPTHSWRHKTPATAKDDNWGGTPELRISD